MLPVHRPKKEPGLLSKKEDEMRMMMTMMMTVSIRRAKVMKTMVSLIGVEAVVGEEVVVVRKVQKKQGVEAVVDRKNQLRAKIQHKKKEL